MPRAEAKNSKIKLFWRNYITPRGNDVARYGNSLTEMDQLGQIVGPVWTHSMTEVVTLHPKTRLAHHAG